MLLILRRSLSKGFEILQQDFFHVDVGTGRDLSLYIPRKILLKNGYLRNGYLKDAKELRGKK